MRRRFPSVCESQVKKGELMCSGGVLNGWKSEDLSEMGRHLHVNLGLPTVGLNYTHSGVTTWMRR